MKRSPITLSFVLAMAFSSCGDSQTTPGTESDPGKMNSTMSTKATGIHQFTVRDLDGNPTPLSDYADQVVLMVNVASKCGLTPQYKGLEALQQSLKGKAFTVLGVPSNDFGGQEPGTPEEIKTFCTATYGVTFPMLEKLSVKNGPQQCELYQYLTQKSRNGVLDAEIAWNFTKILIGKDGLPIRDYESLVTPGNPALRADIERALGA